MYFELFYFVKLQKTYLGFVVITLYTKHDTVWEKGNELNEINYFGIFFQFCCLRVLMERKVLVWKFK